MGREAIRIAMLAGLLLSGCIPVAKIRRQEPDFAARFSTAAFNGDYRNELLMADTANKAAAVTLWATLYKSRYFSEDTVPQEKERIVRLSFDGRHTVSARAIEQGRVVRSITLEGTLNRNYLSLKRYLYLIPIPFIYFRQQEVKVLLGNTGNGDLALKYGDNDFAWVIMSAGFRNIYGGTCRRIK